ncbi:MAG: DUF3035 domain-containing protein [Aestuariivita sp.]|nr:DUF3035 domain-containing protein [Aestuariivita sp.]MCY4347515.1 DUF3035 domain-containing protein [Aestuariivita sp.]
MRLLTMLLAALVLTACSNQGLRDLRHNSEGPDEFMIVPTQPLTPPADFTELPAPTLGQANLTDPNPKSDAILALGGKPTAELGRSITARDRNLVRHVRRNGVPENIRATLMLEDERFRKRRGRFTSFQLFRTNRYQQVYRPLTLDPFREQRRFRRAGIATPSAPPVTN